MKIKDLFPLKAYFTRKKLKKIVYMELLVLFAVIFLTSSITVGDYFVKSYKQKKMYEALSNMVQLENTGTDSLQDYTNAALDDNFTLPPTSRFTKVVDPRNNRALLIQTAYVDIFNVNPDFVGWIRVPGTRINYPVMQTREWVNYYLTRDFYGNQSRYGAIYLNEMADIMRPSDNLTLYGHKMKDGSMFSDLFSYMDKSFFLENPTVSFNSIYENHTYQIFAAFITSADENGFAYHNFVDGTEAEFNAFVTKCKELSLYDTGVEVTYGDKLLTLSTCKLNIPNGRFVVVAKQVS